MINLILGGGVAIVAISILYWMLNLVLTGSAERATSRSADHITGVVGWFLAIGVMVVGGLADGLFAIVLSAPDLMATSVLGLTGFVSLSGLINVQPETWGLLVIVVFVLLSWVRRSEGSGV